MKKLLLALWLLSASSAHALDAFPGAHGFAKAATGGRSSTATVYVVSNLNNSGPGSLRACTEATGPRYCVINVDGYIDLQTRLNINSDVTIAGQTAPGEGLWLRYAPVLDANGPLALIKNASNVIIRHIGFVPGKPSTTLSNGNPANPAVWDALTVESSSNILLDHLAIGWGSDENYNTYGNVRTLTLQYSVIFEGLNWNSHSKGALIGADGPQVGLHSYCRNIVYGSNDRNPDIKAGPTDISNRIDWTNNISHNPRTVWTEIWTHNGGFAGNFENNLFTAGPMTLSTAEAFRHQWVTGLPVDTQQIYQAGNIVSTGYSLSNRALTDPVWRATRWGANSSRCSMLATENVKNDLVSKAGPLYFRRGDLMERIIGYVNSETGGSSLVGTPADVGGYPAVVTGTPWTDTDADGIPDSWEISKGMDPNVFNANSDADADGYPDLEEWLNAAASGSSR